MKCAFPRFTQHTLQVFSYVSNRFTVDLNPRLVNEQITYFLYVCAKGQEVQIDYQRLLCSPP